MFAAEVACTDTNGNNGKLHCVFREQMNLCAPSEVIVPFRF